MVKLLDANGRIILDLSKHGDYLLDQAVEKYGLDSDVYNFAHSIVAVSDYEDRVASDDPPVSLNLSGVLTPVADEHNGTLVTATIGLWTSVARVLRRDWTRAFEIPAQKWEEMIAGAFDRAGFDEVTLTPYSGDHGRDVIAIKKGVGGIKIIDSVKAYKPGHLVKHDDVRALLGVMSGELNTSKGIITTTSDFAPTLKEDPFIRPFLPTRLELVNGQQLQRWLTELSKKPDDK
jgi:restriction system protein